MKITTLTAQQVIDTLKAGNFQHGSARLPATNDTVYKTVQQMITLLECKGENMEITTASPYPRTINICSALLNDSTEYTIELCDPIEPASTAKAEIVQYAQLSERTNQEAMIRDAKDNTLISNMSATRLIACWDMAAAELGDRVAAGEFETTQAIPHIIEVATRIAEDSASAELSRTGRPIFVRIWSRCCDGVETTTFAKYANPAELEKAEQEAHEWGDGCEQWTRITEQQYKDGKPTRRDRFAEQAGY